MIEQIVILIDTTTPSKIFHTLIITLPRPLGFVLGFIVFSWGTARIRTMQVAISIALGLPVYFSNVLVMPSLIPSQQMFYLAPITFKEITIGYGYGLLVSLPFLAMQYAGEITDQFRGESNSGTPDPQGDTLATYSNLYLIIGFYLFFSFDALTVLVDGLYLTYDIWPVLSPVPELTENSIHVLLIVLQDTLKLAIQITVPLLSILFMIEFAVSIASRFGRRFNFYGLAFPLKNLFAVLFLPLIAWFIVNVSGDISERTGDGLEILREMIDE